ncbi:hypothetical protein QWJ34_24185 [Saccharibacillus sp. CPCC 101409]|nr:hypothetical protein [Saccharibacillus sp. CPCC 101409]MDO3412887.1 hypothetical protein [Saccharibacillus sp. CPCC 101409]
MKRKTLMGVAVGLGAAYLLRNKDSRSKLVNQFQSFGSKKEDRVSDSTVI